MKAIVVDLRFVLESDRLYARTSVGGYRPPAYQDHLHCGRPPRYAIAAIKVGCVVRAVCHMRGFGAWTTAGGAL